MFTAALSPVISVEVRDDGLHFYHFLLHLVLLFMETASLLKPHELNLASSFRLFYCSSLTSPSLRRIEESWGLALEEVLAYGNVVCGWVFYPDYSSLLQTADQQEGGFAF